VKLVHLFGFITKKVVGVFPCK